LYLIRHVNSRHSLHETGKELVIGGAGQSEGPQGRVEGPQLPAHLLVHLPRHQEHCVLVNKNKKVYHSLPLKKITYLHGAEIADIHDGLVRTARRRNAVQGQQALQVDDHKPRVVAQLQQRQHHLHPDADAAGHVLPARLAHRPQDGQADGRPVLVAVAQLNKTRQAAHNQVGVDLGQGLRAGLVTNLFRSYNIKFVQAFLFLRTL